MNRRTFIRSTTQGLLSASLLSLNSWQSAPRKIVLIGDSIRKGYQKTVFEILAPDLEVWSPDNNCRTTDHILYQAKNWLEQPTPDLIHMNAGLHDMRTLAYDSPPGHTLVSADDYRQNLETLFWWIKKYVDCKIIWATTTPVIDAYARKAHEKQQDFLRYNSDVIRFNTIAKEVAAQFKIPVNDLYSFVKNELGEDAYNSDGVHFTDAAQQKQGERVAEIIRQTL